MLILAGSALTLLVARWLHVARRFSRPQVPGGGLVRVVGRLRRRGAVSREGAGPFDLVLQGPVELDERGRRVKVLTDDAVLDAGWGTGRAADLRPGQPLTVHGRWITVDRDGLYREAGREAVLDAVRVVVGQRPGLARTGLPVMLAAAAAVMGLGLVNPLPAHMQASAGRLACPEGAHRQTMAYTRNRGWVHQCVLPDGTLHGPLATYFSGGSPRARAVYWRGQLHGTERLWFASGRLRKETEYWRGKRHGAMSAWYDSGQQKVRGRFVHGRRHGLHHRYTGQGQLLEMSSHERGLRHGRTTWWRRGTEWFDTGGLLKVFALADDRLGGPMKVEYGHRRGKLHGQVKLWFHGGARGVGQLRNGRKVGTWLLLTADGSVRRVPLPGARYEALAQVGTVCGTPYSSCSMSSRR